MFHKAISYSRKEDMVYFYKKIKSAICVFLYNIYCILVGLVGCWKK